MNKKIKMQHVRLSLTGQGSSLYSCCWAQCLPWSWKTFKSICCINEWLQREQWRRNEGRGQYTKEQKRILLPAQWVVRMSKNEQQMLTPVGERRLEDDARSKCPPHSATSDSREVRWLRKTQKCSIKLRSKTASDTVSLNTSKGNTFKWKNLVDTTSTKWSTLEQHRWHSLTSLPMTWTAKDTASPLLVYPAMKHLAWV